MNTFPNYYYKHQFRIKMLVICFPGKRVLNIFYHCCLLMRNFRLWWSASSHKDQKRAPISLKLFQEIASQRHWPFFQWAICPNTKQPFYCWNVSKLLTCPFADDREPLAVPRDQLEDLCHFHVPILAERLAVKILSQYFFLCYKTCFLF